MKTHDELLQRCFDADLNDDELKDLFAAMSTNGELRKQFRMMQLLRSELRSIQNPKVPPRLDDRIGKLTTVRQINMVPARSAVRRMISKKYSFSLPAIAATILLLLAGSYFTATNILAQRQEPEYVYIIQLPQIEVHAVLN